MVLKLNSFSLKLICCLSVFFTNILYSQNGKWSNDLWEKRTRDIDYDPVNPVMLDFLKDLLNNNSLSAFRIVFIVIVLVLLVIGLFFVIKSQLKLRKSIVNKDAYSLSIEDIEEKIKELNLFDLLKDAINNKAFKKAIRIQYLILLKTLDEKGFISFQKDKTNKVYINELKNDKFKQLLFSQTVEFERLWYGNVQKVSADVFYENNRVYSEALKIIEDENK